MHKKEFFCDYLVIGTGAGGSVAGALLAEKGFDVIFLEEGGYHKANSFTNEVGDMTSKLYRNGGVFPFFGFPIIPLAEGCCVGGGTVINGAGLFRTPKKILKEWSDSYGLKGYNYSKLRPHFETIEKDLNVESNPIKKDTNLDSHKIIEGAKKLGWRTEFVPRAVKGCSLNNRCSTGCPKEAKQSTLVTYLPKALKFGARILSNYRAIKIKHSRGVAHTVIAESNNDKIVIKFTHLVVACGSIQTPHLLRRSGISKLAGRNLQFHMNIKVIAKMSDFIYPENGTMFPVQIHEFEQDDCYINTSVVNPTYLSMSLASHGGQAINDALSSFNKMMIVNTTMRVESKAHIISRMSKNPIVWYKFDKNDLPKIKTNVKRMCQVLFQSGAIKIYLPVKNTQSISSMEEVDALLHKCSSNDFDINTVHMMASCPMGMNVDSVVDLNGHVYGMKNVILADASILPSNIGQSPQETIMAIVHEVINRHLNKVDRADS
jgi:choline dehydrogenase-like flavoprotein